MPLPTDRPTPIVYPVGPGQSSATNDAVVSTLVNEYGVTPEAAVALARRFGAGAPDQGVQGVAMERTAQQEIDRLRQINYYLDTKRKIAAGESVPDSARSYADRVDAAHRAAVKARAQAAGAEDASKREDEAAYERARQVTRDIAAAHPGTKLVQGGAGFEIPQRVAKAVVQVPYPPVINTALAAMKKFGADPQTATKFAMQLHGGAPAAQGQLVSESERRMMEGAP